MDATCDRCGERFEAEAEAGDGQAVGYDLCSDCAERLTRPRRLSEIRESEGRCRSFRLSSRPRNRPALRRTATPIEGKDVSAPVSL